MSQLSGDIRPYLQMVRYTKPEATDEPGYLDWVEVTMVGVEEAFNMKQTYLVKIDNWFGKQWFGFSGRALGALGVRKKKLTLAFHPHACPSVSCLKAMPNLAAARAFMCGNGVGRISSGTLRSFFSAHTHFGTAAAPRRTIAEHRPSRDRRVRAG
jgi:hypothetical protein